MGWEPCGVYSVSSVYRALGLDVCGVYSVCIIYKVFELDVCGVHSVCSIYEVFGLVIFVAFRVFVAFMDLWGGTLVAFTALVVLMANEGVTIHIPCDSIRFRFYFDSISIPFYKIAKMVRAL